MGRTGADGVRCVKIWDYLQIDGAFTQNLSNYGYLARGGAGVLSGSGGNIAISIKTAGRIVCPEFDATSDSRVKKDFGKSDPEADLKTLNQIRITDYRYKDQPAFGDK